MRTVIQRVTKASVTVGDELISSIGRGLCVLVGISKDDTPKEREYIVRKILNLRLFDDENDKRWAKSVKDKQLEILCVSQFTLYSILKGNKPDFHQAMPGDQSQTYYNEFLDMLRKDYNPDKIKDGQFGAHMQVHIQNDGPVTIQLDSPPDSGISTGQESAGNTDLLRHSRQAPANLKRKRRGIPTSSVGCAPLHSDQETLENSEGYLACSVCSNGLTHVDERHLTTTVCSNCGRGLHQDCSVLHRCDLNSDIHGINHNTENTDVDGIMIHAPARVCVECQQGGVMAMCAGCDHNLHEMCRAQHECPALAQHKHPTLSQLLHKKYSKYGHRSKPPEAQQPKKSFRLERCKTKKDCCICSNRGAGVHIRRRSQTVCYYCKRGLHWECRFRHKCELMTTDPEQLADGGTNVVFLTGGNRKRRDCIVCSQRRLGKRHRSRTICKFCKKGLHRKCEHKHMCAWMKNEEEVNENELHRSSSGSQKKKRKTDSKACSTLLDNSSSQLLMANEISTHSIGRSNSNANLQLSAQPQLNSHTQLNSRTQLNSHTQHNSHTQLNSPSQLNSHMRLNTQERLLSQLKLRPHETQTHAHRNTLAQTSTALAETCNIKVEIEENCEFISNAVNHTEVESTQGHHFLQEDIESDRKPTVVKILGDDVRDCRKDCIVCSSRTCFGRRKRAYTQCSLCKKGLHYRCLQFHVCGLSKQHPKYDVPYVSSAVDKTTVFTWGDKADDMVEEANKLSDAFSQEDNPEVVAMLVKCGPQSLVDCNECAYHDGNKKMTHLMCNVCGKGVHRKCFYRHQCFRDEENKEKHVPNLNTGTFVGERPLVVRIESCEVKDGRKACDVCSGKRRDGKRNRSRTQCAVCRRGLHVRCLAQHICPGSNVSNPQDSSFTTLSKATMPITIPNDEEMNEVEPSLEPDQQHLSTPSTSNANFIDADHSAVPMKDQKNKDSNLLKTGQDKFCTECHSGQKTRMACLVCKENVHIRCEWRHYCKFNDTSKGNTVAITGGRFTGDVVPILVSDVKTRKKDCAVCSNRKAGRRSRSSTMCPHCKKGLHRICAPQHICPMINLPQEFTEMDTSDNQEPFEDDDDDMGYVEINDGITRYCCVCSTSRKSQITRTACSSCDRGLHPQCVLLHNCHSMVPRRLQVPETYQKRTTCGDNVTQDVEKVRSITALVDKEEASNHQENSIHEDIDDEYEDMVQGLASNGDPKQTSQVSQTSVKGFDTGVTSVKLLDERKDRSGERKKYLLVTDDSSDEFSQAEEENSTEDPDEEDTSMRKKAEEVGQKVAERKHKIDGFKAEPTEGEGFHQQQSELTNNSEYPLNKGNELNDMNSKTHDTCSSVETVHPALTHTELILECSNSPEDMQIGCFSTLDDMSPANPILTEGSTQDLEDIVAHIREELSQVVGVEDQIIDLRQVEGEVLAIDSV